MSFFSQFYKYNINNGYFCPFITCNDACENDDTAKF